MPRYLVGAAMLLATACSTVDRDPSATASGMADELLDADHGFAVMAASANVVDAIGNLLAPDAWMPAGGTLYSGREAVLDYLRANPDNLSGHLEWAPVRGGLSADGQHGFSFGFMTLVQPDSTTVALKYLAYWVKGTDGWKAVAYKRARRGAGDVPLTMLPPALPDGMVDVNYNEADGVRLAEELGGVERAFSELAGEIGLGPAFQRHAAPDAMNLGGPDHADFVYGPEAIAAVVGAGQDGPSPLTWGPDHVIVASSGDLGVSIGHILIPGAADSPSLRVPFFTVWRRASSTEPWRFVAE